MLFCPLPRLFKTTYSVVNVGELVYRTKEANVNWCEARKQTQVGEETDVARSGKEDGFAWVGEGEGEG